jgi:pimeloyl-ACP methyl ester carboxylesterase
VSVPTEAAAPLGGSNAIVGDLCTLSGATPRVLQVLVHGGTYSSVYWDLPGFNNLYSYSKFMNRSGYATLAIDLLGVNRSSHPASILLTEDAQAQALHDVVQAAKAGRLGQSFDRVVVVGHSIGSITAVVEDATYHDVDGLVLSGLSHSPGALGLTRLATYARPALLDPVTAPQIPPLDLGYLSAPGSRAVFYAPGEADPAVVAADEADRAPLSAIQLATFPEYLVLTGLINVPTLLADGQDDVIFCSGGGGGSLTDCSTAETLHAAEAPFFAPAARLQTFVLPGAGHIVNFNYNAATWFEGALQWFQRWQP